MLLICKFLPYGLYKVAHTSVCRCAFCLSPSSNPPFFQKSLKQRLGKSNIQARLGRPAGPLTRGGLGGRGLPMGHRGLPRGAMRGGRGARGLLRGGISLRGEYPLGAGEGLKKRSGFLIYALWQQDCNLWFSWPCNVWPS